MTTTTYAIGQTISGTFSKLPFAGTVVGYLGNHCLKIQVENPVRGLPACIDLISKLPNILIIDVGAKNVTIDAAIPRCGTCNAVLGDFGRCEACDDRAEQPTPYTVGTSYTGHIVARVGDHLVVELSGEYSEPPIAQSWISEDGFVLWPCRPDELVASDVNWGS